MMKRFLIIGLLALVSATPAMAASGKLAPSNAVLAGAAPKYPDSLPQKRFEIRNPKNVIVTLETDLGKMVLELYRDVAPAHADSFLARCNDGFYNGTKFHRIIKTFMIQGGNPFLVGKQNVSYYLPNELNDLNHEFGTLSMASRGAPTTAQTQFFICTDRNRSTQSLDGKYVAFGHVLKGFDVLWAISRIPVEKSKQGGEESQPTKDVWLKKAYRSDAEGNPLK
jgi:cyclophilin family peptidyl-prolyl cis-trans isomerase